MKNFAMICSLTLSLMPIATEALDLTGSGSQTHYRVTSLLDDSGQSKIEIDIPDSNKSVSAYFELGDGGVIQGYFPGEFTIYTNYNTRDPLISAYTFRWNPEIKDWIAYRESNWEEPCRDEAYSLGKEPIPDNLRLPQNFKTHRIKCCAKFSDFKRNSAPNLEKESPTDEIKSIESDFKKISTALREGKDKEIFSQEIDGEPLKKIAPPDLSHELSRILSKNNLVELNNFAYLLQKNNDNISAALVLQSIHEKYPSRTVAQLNLADSYWELGMRDSACPLYAQYIASMKSSGKQGKIPKTALDREKCE